MRSSFSRSAPAQALRDWHAGLEHNKGARARLRRASGPGEIVYVPEFQRLLAELSAWLRVDDPKVQRRLAALAGLAARVRESRTGLSLAFQMGTLTGTGPVVSEHRFRRLLTSASLEDRYLQLSRILHLLGHSADLLSLAEAAVDWDDDPDLRQRWAYEYYQASLPPKSSRGDS